VAELGDAARFAQKAIQVLLSGEIAGPRNFDGNGSVELRIARAVDGSERSSPDCFEQLEAADLAAFEGLPARARAAFQPNGRSTSGTHNLLAVFQCRQFHWILTLRAKKVHGGSLRKACAFARDGTMNSTLKRSSRQSLSGRRSLSVANCRED